MHINMKKEKKYIEYILKQAEALLAIDSPSGFTEKVTDYLCEEYKRLGYKPVKTKKGGVLVEIGGKGNAVLTMAHVDTLGGMVFSCLHTIPQDGTPLDVECLGLHVHVDAVQGRRIPQAQVSRVQTAE